MGRILYLVLSRCLMIDLAETMETSCSVLVPPKITATVGLLVIALVMDSCSILCL